MVFASVLMLMCWSAACSDDDSEQSTGQQFQTGSGVTGETPEEISESAATGGAGDVPTDDQAELEPTPTTPQRVQDSGIGGDQVVRDNFPSTTENQTSQDSGSSESQADAAAAPAADATADSVQTSPIDTSPIDTTADSVQTRPVTIHYWTQSSFSISVEGGVTVVTDPYMPSPTVEADVVTVSHEHMDHSLVDGVPGTYEVIRSEAGVGQHEAAGITFTGVASLHGANLGSNTIFVWEMEGIRFAHLGDLGSLLTDDQIVQIGAVDVLMLPTLGTIVTTPVTVDAPTAVQVAQQLSAKLVLPMHYQMFGGPGPFIDAVPDDWTLEQPDAASITVTAADFDEEGTRAVVLVP